MDYLSFLTIRHKTSPTYPCIDWQDYIILNSTANVDKALYPLGEYEKIHCLLDNDEAGRKATQAIQKEYGWRFNIGYARNGRIEPQSDTQAVSDGFVSVTPVCLDMTDKTQLPYFKAIYS